MLFDKRPLLLLITIILAQSLSAEDRLSKIDITSSDSTSTMIQTETRPRSKLEDQLQMLPGVSISYGQGGDQSPSLQYRGLKGQKLPTRINGILINQTSSRLEMWDLLPVELVQSIETGPQGINFNLIDNGRNKISTTAGSFGDRRLSAGLSTNRGDWQIAGTYFYGEEENNYRFNNPRKTSLYDAQAADTLTMKNNDQHKQSFLVQGKNKKMDFDIFYFQGVKESGVPGIMGRFFNRVRQEKEMGIASINWRGLSLNNQRQKYQFNDPSGENNGIPLFYKRTNERNELAYNRSLEISRSFVISALIQTSKERYQDSNINSSRSIVDGEVTGQYSINKSNSLAVSGGSLYSNLQGHYKKYGVGWSLNKELHQLNLSFNLNNRLPTMDELYLKEGIAVGNSTLIPETNRTAEISYGWRKKSFLINATLYQIETQNRIQSLMVGGYRYQPQNIGQSQTRGIELKTSIPIIDFVQLRTSASWQRSIDKNKDGNNYGKLIPFVPQFNSSSWLDIGREHKLLVSLGWENSIGRMANTENSVGVPDRSIFNIQTNYKISKSDRAILSLDNIFDKNNYDYWGYPLMGRKLWGRYELYF